MKRGTVEVAVVGGGPAGLTAAIALAAAGVETALIAKAPPADNRTTALLSGSVAALEALDVWPLCRDQSAPLTAIRLIDDTPRLIRAPEVTVRSRRDRARGLRPQHREPASDRGARHSARRRCRSLRGSATTVTAVEAGRCRRHDPLDDGEAIAARLVVGADGRKSLCRAAAGIETERRELSAGRADAQSRPRAPAQRHLDRVPYRERAVHARSPARPAIEPRLRASIRDEAEQLAALDAAALSDEIERRAHSILGKMTVEDGRGLFPLGDRNRAQLCGAIASRLSAKPRMSSRRSARRG